MDTQRPSAAQIAEAVGQASHAPSVHNSQPWQWRVTSTSLDLFADRTRRLKVTDPFGRLLLHSCGASLHHLFVAMGAAGWHAEILRFPDPGNPSHLASITFAAAEPDRHTIALAEAISSRRTDRRLMSTWEVPDGHIRNLVSIAADHGVIAQPLSPAQISAWEELGRQAEKRTVVPSYRQELYEWTHRRKADQDGVPSSNRPSVDSAAVPDLNRFPPGDLAPTRHASDSVQPVSLLLSTSSDDPLARLRAGEAISAILLEATVLGLATAIDSQIVEVESTRSAVENELLSGTRSPQILVTVGWPTMAEPLPETPRREISDILQLTVPANRVLADQKIHSHRVFPT